MDKEIDKLFKRVELLKSFDRCGFEFADGNNCTFDNIAICYDDRLKLYELVKKQKEVIDKAIGYIQENTCWELRTSKVLDILKEVSE